MKFSIYIKENIVYFSVKLLMYIFIALMLNAFKVNVYCIIAVFVLLLVYDFLFVFFNYYKKQKFYKRFLHNLEEIDKKYLVVETLDEPEFQEAKILVEAISDINSCMQDELSYVSNNLREYKEYIELWIHEIKLPVASLLLMNYNKNTDLVKEKQKLDAIDMYLEQILFFARADESEKDYILSKVNLENIVNNVLKNDKDLFIGNKIKVIKENVSLFVYTDAKWLEFIIGQVVANSIKYKRNETDSFISFKGEDYKEKVVIVIEDNGIGISEMDIKRVFDKSFTGMNGRTGRKSTGMGLYLCKKLCKKLGHSISIESKKDEYTKVYIEFSKNDYYIC